MKITLALVAMMALLSCTATVSAQGGPAQSIKAYSLAEIATVLSVAYAFTYLLMKRKKISIASFRKIWNVALLMSFLVVGILGILLVIRINYGWALFQNFLMLYYHVEAGIAMAVITVFHLHIYGRYYKCLIRMGKKCDT